MTGIFRAVLIWAITDQSEQPLNPWEAVSVHGDGIGAFLLGDAGDLEGVFFLRRPPRADLDGQGKRRCLSRRLQDEPDFFRILISAAPAHRRITGFTGQPMLMSTASASPPLRSPRPPRPARRDRAEDLGNQGPVAGIRAQIVERRLVSPDKAVCTDHFRVAKAAAVPADDGPKARSVIPARGP